jgi:hypothetical protein
MEHSKDSTGLQSKPVTVVLDERESVKQPNNFRVCPLGIQLYSPRPLPEFEILEFKISIPGANGSKCEPSLYRIWVKFLDLPEAKRSRLECLSKTAKLTCPYCENF